MVVRGREGEREGEREREKGREGGREEERERERERVCVCVNASLTAPFAAVSPKVVH